MPFLPLSLSPYLPFSPSHLLPLKSLKFKYNENPKAIIKPNKVTLSTSSELKSIPVILSARYLRYEYGRFDSPSLSSTLKCQSVKGQYPNVPTKKPRISHEAPVRSRTTRFHNRVFFQIQPKRLKRIREEWNRIKNMSRM